MMQTKVTRVFGLASAMGLVAIMAAGCSSSDDAVSPIRQGVFLDSAVAGLQYTTASQSGTTDIDGTYRYQAGESVTFSIGDLALPAIAASPIVTPISVFSADGVNDNRVANLTRLLLSLDADGEADNGIEISATAATAAPLNLDFGSANFDTDVANFVANSGSVATSMIDRNTAIAHLQQTLADNGLVASGCGSTHPDVGSSVPFATFFHNVVGTLTVVDDCTIEITEFAYDGQGPAVYFYSANGDDFGADEAFIMGPMLNGTVYSGDRFTLKLPDGKTLDDVDGISVWCADFRVSFGTASFAG